MMKNFPRFSKLRVESLEERTLLAVMAGGIEQVAELVAPTGSQTRIVNTLEDPTSWDTTDDVVSLREAIGRATTGDTIVFDDSLSGGTIALSGSQLTIPVGITIDASGIGGITIDAAEQSGVLNINGGDPGNPVELIGLTITGGSFHGIHNTGVLVIIDSTISGNTAAFGYGGGGICNNGGRVSLTSCTISDNSSQHMGGGVWNYSEGSMTLTGCTISGNSSGSSVGSAGGGGICNGGWNNSVCTMTLVNCTVSGNGDRYSGGGILNNAKSDIIITNCVISDNHAGSGGGVQNNGRMTLSDSTISENTAYVYYGGGVSNYTGGTAEISNCAIIGNRVMSSAYSDYFGGGGICSLGDLNCISSTIAANSARNGGGIFHSNSLTRNSSEITLINTIVAQNYSEDENEIAIVGEISGHDNIIGIDPGFKVAPIFESGTLTNFDSLDVSLTSVSPAIDCGDNSAVTAEIDVAGNPRIINRIVDIGAYEYQGGGTEQLASPTITTGNKGVYVSYGANRHQIRWNAFENVSGYELQYSADGSRWMTVSVSDPVAVVTGLIYGQNVKYRVRALGDGISYTDSDWSAVKVFNVCPMDINGDGDLSGCDRALLGNSWLSEEGEDNYLSAADIDGDGNISGGDRVYLSNNWLLNVEDDADDLLYPPAKASDAVFAGFASADLAADLNVF